ncbi:hypothetical protein X975_03445, partial [Stegodyphus mimosarum]
MFIFNFSKSPSILPTSVSSTSKLLKEDESCGGGLDTITIFRGRIHKTFIAIKDFFVS